MAIMIVCLFLVMLVLSFIKTQFRAIAIAASGAFLALVCKSLAKHHYPSADMASGIIDGIAHDAESIFILLYIFYVLVLLNSWKGSKKVGNTRAALRIKHGLIGVPIVFIVTLVISSLDLYNVDNEWESKAYAEYLNKYKLISDSIAKDGNNYNLYSARALLGKNFLYKGTRFYFENDTAAKSDLKKAYSLNPNDYNFVFHLFNDYWNWDDNISITEKVRAKRIMQRSGSLKKGNDSLYDLQGNEVGEFLLYRSQQLLLDSLNKELQYDPDDYRQHHSRALLLEEMGDTVSAALDAEILIPRHPDYDRSLFNDMAAYYLRHGDIKKCDRWYDHVLVNENVHKNTYDYFCTRAERKEDFNKKAAIEDYKKALNYEHADNFARKRLYEIYLSLGDSANAGKYETNKDSSNASY